MNFMLNSPHTVHYVFIKWAVDLNKCRDINKLGFWSLVFEDEMDFLYNCVPSYSLSRQKKLEIQESLELHHPVMCSHLRTVKTGVEEVTIRRQTQPSVKENLDLQLKLKEVGKTSEGKCNNLTYPSSCYDN